MEKKMPELDDLGQNAMLNELAERLAEFGVTRRLFMKGAAAAGLLAAMGPYAAEAKGVDAKGNVVIIGAGAAGLSVAVRLSKRLRNAKITLIDPAERQYYQPGFTLIAAGVYQPDEVFKLQKDLIPRAKGVKWIKKAVVALDPDKKKVSLAGGESVDYDFLVLTPGIQMRWEEIQGISFKTLGTGNAHSIYAFEGAQRTRDAMAAFSKKGGVGIFTDTYTKHKCGGAPKKVCLLTEHQFRKNKTREKATFKYFTGSKDLYDVPFFTPRLKEIYKERNIPFTVKTRLTAVDTAAKKAYFEKTEKVVREVKNPQTGKIEKVESSRKVKFTEEYDFLHFAPPQGTPDFVRKSGLGWREGKLARDGWVEVDKYTLVHRVYPNVISLGDAAGIPTSKTSAAARIQIPIAVENLCALMEGKAPTAKYNGYAACPIVTDYGHVLLAEFDYDKKPCISFPFSLLDMSMEQRAAWWLKVYVLKPLFFYGMLNGWA